MFFMQIFWRFAKGPLISEWIYEVIVSPKIRTKNCQDFCPHYTGQKSWQFFVCILEETMTSWIHSENNWPLSTVLIHGNGLFTAQLCLLTFYAAAFSLGKYEKWRNINLVKLHANSIALLEKTQFFVAWFLQKSTEDLFLKAHYSWYNSNFYKSTNYFYMKKSRSNFFWRFAKEYITM